MWLCQTPQEMGGGGAVPVGGRGQRRLLGVGDLEEPADAWEPGRWRGGRGRHPGAAEASGNQDHIEGVHLGSKLSSDAAIFAYSSNVYLIQPQRSLPSFTGCG